MKLSLIVPIYKKERVVRRSISRALKVLDQLLPDYEIIAVVDGSPDNSLDEVKKISHNRLKVINSEENLGKGGAIRQGFQEAQGEYVGFMDCGLDINPASLVYYIKELENGYDAYISNRFVEPTVYKSSLRRKIYSFGFNFVRDMLFNINVKDTQVGLKIFKKSSINLILPYLQENRWLLDIEILTYLKEMGRDNFLELPVIVDIDAEGDNSQSSKPGEVLKIFNDLFRLSARIGRLSYILFWNRHGIKSLKLSLQK